VVLRRHYQDLVQHLVRHTLSHHDENATGVYAATESTLECIKSWRQFSEQAGEWLTC
jgi:hypothetical protein